MEQALEDPVLQDALRYLEDHVQSTVEELIRLTETPAPTFAEAGRATYVLERLLRLGLQDAAVDEAGNVVATWAGAESGQPAVLIAAHMDTVFPVGTPLQVQREDGKLSGPGVGDNASNLAAMLAVAEALAEVGLRFRRDILFAATVGEEGLGDLCGMRHLMDRLRGRVGWVIAADGGLGGLVHQGVGSRRLRLTCLAQGGHSWGAFGAPSAVHTLGRIIAEISRLTVPRNPRTTYNVGVVSGGTSVNTIAPEAQALIDLRSVDETELGRLEARVRRIVSQVTAAAGASYRLEVIGDRPTGSISGDHPLVEAVRAVHRLLGIETRALPSSTDGNVPLQMGIPAVTIGVTIGGNGHLTSEYIYTKPLATGLKQILLLLALMQALPAGNA